MVAQGLKNASRLGMIVVPGICIGLVAMAFWLNIVDARRLKMDTEPPVWVVDAIPPALSQLVFDHARHYTSINAVYDSFFAQIKQDRSAPGINQAIAAIVAESPAISDRSDRLLGNDDKGIVDLTTFAFRLMGYKVENVLYMYYVIFGVSALLFVVSYVRNVAALLWLAAFFWMCDALLPMIKFNSQLGAVTSLRCMPILAMVACMHCLLFQWEAKVDAKTIVCAAAQVAVIVFVIYIRSTTFWELLIVGLLSLVVSLLHKGPTADLRAPALLQARRWPAAVPVVASILLMLALQAHRNWDFPDEYKTGDQGRSFWHNIFSGLAVNPVLADRYELRIDDMSVIQATGRYLVESGREDDWQAIGGTSPGYSHIRWGRYDEAVKDMMFARCTQYFGQCIAAFLWYKPFSLVNHVLWLWGLRDLPPDIDLWASKFFGPVVKDEIVVTTSRLDATHSRERLWFPRILVASLGFLIVSLVREWRNQLQPVFVSTLLLALGSLSPAMVGYPAPHTICETAIAAALVLTLVPGSLRSSLRRSR
jgi:hypothetical protein